MQRRGHQRHGGGARALGIPASDVPLIAAPAIDGRPSAEWFPAAHAPAIGGFIVMGLVAVAYHARTGVRRAGRAYRNELSIMVPLLAITAAAALVLRRTLA